MSQAQTADNVIPMFDRRITAEQVRLSDSAHAQMKALVEAEDGIEGVRIFVAGGGCGGMSYSMTFATERFEHDAVMEREGLAIMVDAFALSFLEGVEIDYVENPTGASFVFRNVFQSIGGGGGCAGCAAAR